MKTYILKHISFFIIYYNLFPKLTKLHNYLHNFESQVYEIQHQSTPLIPYILTFKSHPYPPNHIITKIFNYFK